MKTGSCPQCGVDITTHVMITSGTDMDGNSLPPIILCPLGFINWNTYSNMP